MRGALCTCLFTLCSLGLGLGESRGGQNLGQQQWGAAGSQQAGLWPPRRQQQAPGLQGQAQPGQQWLKWPSPPPAAAAQPQMMEQRQHHQTGGFAGAITLLELSDEFIAKGRFADARGMLVAAARLSGGGSDLLSVLELAAQLRRRMGLAEATPGEIDRWLGWRQTQAHHPSREAEMDWAEVPSTAAAPPQHQEPRHFPATLTLLSPQVVVISLLLLLLAVASLLLWATSKRDLGEETETDDLADMLPEGPGQVETPSPLSETEGRPEAPASWPREAPESGLPHAPLAEQRPELQVEDPQRTAEALREPLLPGHSIVADDGAEEEEEEEGESHWANAAEDADEDEEEEEVNEAAPAPVAVPEPLPVPEPSAPAPTLLAPHTPPMQPILATTMAGTSGPMGYVPIAVPVVTPVHMATYSVAPLPPLEPQPQPQTAAPAPVEVIWGTMRRPVGKRWGEVEDDDDEDHDFREAPPPLQEVHVAPTTTGQSALPQEEAETRAAPPVQEEEAANEQNVEVLDGDDEWDDWDESPDDLRASHVTEQLEETAPYEEDLKAGRDLLAQEEENGAEEGEEEEEEDEEEREEEVNADLDLKAVRGITAQDLGEDCEEEDWGWGSVNHSADEIQPRRRQEVKPPPPQDFDDEAYRPANSAWESERPLSFDEPPPVRARQGAVPRRGNPTATSAPPDSRSTAAAPERRVEAAADGLVYFTGRPSNRTGKRSSSTSRAWRAGRRGEHDEREIEEEDEGFVSARPTIILPTGCHVRMAGGEEAFLPVEHMEPYTEAATNAVRERVKGPTGNNRLQVRHFGEGLVTMLSQGRLREKSQELEARQCLMKEGIAVLRNNFEPRKWRTGRISSVNERGVHVSLCPGKDAYIPASEILEKFWAKQEGDEPEDEGATGGLRLELGQTVEFRVTKFSWENDAFTASMLSLEDSQARRRNTRGEFGDDGPRSAPAAARTTGAEEEEVREQHARLSQKGFSIVDSRTADELNSWLKQNTEERKAKESGGKMAKSNDQKFMVCAAKGANSKSIGQVSLPKSASEKEVKEAALALAVKSGQLNNPKDHKGVLIQKNVITVKV